VVALEREKKILSADVTGLSCIVVEKCSITLHMHGASDETHLYYLSSVNLFS
jgi:hypothetical protein